MLSLSGFDASAYWLREDLLLKCPLPQDSERRRWVGCSIAVSAEASALAGNMGHGFIAMVLCSGCLLALWWHYRQETIMSGDCDVSAHGSRSLTSMLLVFCHPDRRMDLVSLARGGQTKGSRQDYPMKV
jgi:hypothetical protein